MTYRKVDSNGKLIEEGSKKREKRKQKRREREMILTYFITP